MWVCSLTQACSLPTAGKGLVEAAHFCYLMAHVPFGYYTVKTDYLALLGSSHRYTHLQGGREWEDVFQGIGFALAGFHGFIFPLSFVNFQLLLTVFEHR